MSSNEPTQPARTDRRGFLRTAAGTAAATGALAAGASPAVAQEFGGWFDGVPNYDGEVVDRTGEDQVTVEVGVDTGEGPYGFGPPAVRIDPGTEITFTWVSDTHNVVVEDQPDGAGWEGHEPIENDGFEFASTLDTEGVYRYFCDPHRTLGMRAAIVVGDVDVGGGGGEGGDGGGEGDESGLLSPGMLTLGGALLLAALSPVVFGLYLLTRRGESPPDGEERVADGHGAASAAGHGTATGRETPAGAPVTEVAEEPEPSRELGHEEFDPVGTASLVAVYLAILVVMWVFMYFVEFLGRGPTVVG